MTIREYLAREAQRITDHALRDFTDREAWQRLLYLYAPLVRYWCRTWGMQGADAEDIQQDVFLVVSQRLHRRIVQDVDVEVRRRPSAAHREERGVPLETQHEASVRRNRELLEVVLGPARVEVVGGASQERGAAECAGGVGRPKFWKGSSK